MHVSMHFSPIGGGWNLSQFGTEMSCLAICEFAEHVKHVQRHTKGESVPQLNWYFFNLLLSVLTFADQKSTTHKASKKVPEKYVIITNNEFVRLRYLVVFAKESQPMIKDATTVQKGFVFRIVNNKSIVFVVFYAVLLFAIGYGNTNNYNYFKMIFWRKVQIVFHYLKTNYLDEMTPFWRYQTK